MSESLQWEIWDWTGRETWFEHGVGLWAWGLWLQRGLSTSSGAVTDRVAPGWSDRKVFLILQHVRALLYQNCIQFHFTSSRWRIYRALLVYVQYIVHTNNVLIVKLKQWSLRHCSDENILTFSCIRDDTSWMLTRLSLISGQNSCQEVPRQPELLHHLGIAWLPPQNQLCWKRPLWSSSPAINTALPSPALNHFPKKPIPEYKFLNTTRDGDSTISLGCLFWYLAILLVKEFFTCGCFLFSYVSDCLGLLLQN